MRMPAKSSPPHIRAEGSVPRMMWTVVLALLPAILVSFFPFRFQNFRITSVAVAVALLLEMGIRKIFGKRASPEDGSAVVTALLLALLLPPNLPPRWMAFSAFFAIVVGKEIFGGLGQNPFNPALVGVAFLLASFPSVQGGAIVPRPMLLAISLGGVLLLLKKLIYWEVPLLYLGSLFIFSLALGMDPRPVLLSRGVLPAAFFMVTDPVTTPLTRWGGRGFALGAGLLAAMICRGTNALEGVTFGILLTNALNPWLDRWLRPGHPS